MDRFFGREQELSSLNSLYNTGNFQMVVMYGRRRIGKTTLIQKFIADKPAINFTAQETTDTLNLIAFSKRIYDFFNIHPSIGTFESWESAFDYLADKAMTTQFILSFDEFPYAVSANKTLLSIMQYLIDHKLKRSKIFIILCGSQVSFMEGKVLGYKSPLFGRRTAQLNIQGFDYFDAAHFMPGFSAIEKISLYSAIGGTPHYLAQINPDESVEENIMRLYFNISGYMYNEPMMLLQQELREPAMYNAIISTIASGITRISEIANAIKEEPTKVMKYIKTLMDLHIISKAVPFGENKETSRRGIYLINDFSYLFWYRFVFPNKPEVESGYGYDIATNEVFGENFAAYIGKPPFETIALQYLIRLNRESKLPFKATSHGTWWGNDPKAKTQSDFDLVLANHKTKEIILGECKWKNNLKDVEEIDRLREKTHLLKEYTDRYYFFFSKVPFSKAATSLSNERLVLITADDLYNI